MELLARACKAGDFRPGQPVRLVREPNNRYDPKAVAVYSVAGNQVAAYVNKQKAAMLTKLIDSGTELHAISTAGTGPGRPCERIAILAAEPRVLAQLLSPRPAHLPPPAHLR